MKKMFVTGMNMNEPKTYVEPEMKVIEVDVTCLNSTSGPEDSVETGEGEEGESGGDIIPEGIKLYRFNIWD